MGALFRNLPIPQKNNPVAELGRAEPVGNKNTGFSFGQLVIFLVDFPLRQRIQRRRRLVQNENGAVLL